MFILGLINEIYDIFSNNNTYYVLCNDRTIKYKN